MLAFENVSLSIPRQELALPCGSKSMSSVRFSAAARHALKLTDVVVLPTPPY